MMSTDVFHAIAHPVRRQILDTLLVGEATVTDLTSPHQMSRPAVSQHLRVLREAGLVRERRSGRHRVYRIELAPLVEVGDWLSNYDSFWQARLSALGHFLEDRHGPA